MANYRVANHIASADLPGHFRPAFTVGLYIVGNHFEVNIMQQPGQSPLFFIFAETPGQGAHNRFHGQHVSDQILILDILSDGS
jgi:hypothetical protein